MKTKIVLLGIALSFQYFGMAAETWNIHKLKDQVVIQSGIFQWKIDHLHSKPESGLYVSGRRINKPGFGEFEAVFYKASPNVEPQGIAYSSKGGVEQTDAVKNQTDALSVNKNGGVVAQNVEWIDSLKVSETNFLRVFNHYDVNISEAIPNVKSVRMRFSSDNLLNGITLEINYEIYRTFPVIRKWMSILNSGDQWVKVSNLILENPFLQEPFSHPTLLTPNSRKIDPSIVAFSDSLAETGIILSSEVPPKLRYLSMNGTTGYNPDLFEWVIGPGEEFTSEPVSLYAFSGKTEATVSAVSTALDRCVESEFRDFQDEWVLYKQDPAKNIVPVFCTWTNYSANINEQNMSKAADIASRMGFQCFQLDAGWSDTGPNGDWAVSIPRPNLQNFSDLNRMSNYIGSVNMKTGLWYSDFVSEQLTGKPQNEPPVFSLPLIRRSGGLGLSFCYEPSREKYVSDILLLHKQFNACYFKQDLSNVCYGDIARGHESRTLKESYLRGLRGLLATQDEIHRQAPGVWLQLSHEIYWETPGPEADVAVLKHVDSYHSAPNEYWGAGNRSKLVSPEWKYKPDSLRQKLVQGAFRARKLWYDHRGLPLNRIEVFGAVTTNFKGSLTNDVIDRQICSWLMGAPISFSGDLTSLTEENIQQYSNRFARLKSLHDKYGIYTHFQFSGVPAPTDEDWHWWGKLNKDGYGIVVVMRGRAGEESRKINIPWVKQATIYQVKTLLHEQNLGRFSGKQLQDGDLSCALSPWTQEIIEVSELK